MPSSFSPPGLERPARPVSNWHFVLSLLALLFFAVMAPLPAAVEWIGSRSWQTAPATILSHEVKDMHRSRTSDDFRASVRYQFSQTSSTYSGDRMDLWMGPYFSSRQAAERYLQNTYPLGGTVTVHFDPSNPAKSALNPFVPWHILGLALLLSLACLSIATQLAWRVLRKEEHL